MVLSHAAILDERYSIQSILGEVGPYDVSYLAWDVTSEHEVVIREYYPLQLARRAKNGHTIEVHEPGLFEFGLAAYSNESALLEELNHPHVVNGSRRFLENGTLYRVSDHVSGVRLSAYVKQMGGALSEEQALELLTPVLDALHASHTRNLFHSNLSPKSIFMQDGEKPVLLNFQKARVLLAQQCGHPADILVDGFYPPEMILINGREGAWWDLYACGATLYYLLTGQPLPTFTDRSKHERLCQSAIRSSGISPNLQEILVHCLAFDPVNRPDSAKRLHRLFQEALQDIKRLDATPPRQKPVEIGFAAHHADQPAESVWHKHDDTHSGEILLNANSFLREAENNGEAKKADSGNSRDVPLRRSRMLPDETESHEDIEIILSQLAKRQQLFSMTMFGVIVLVLGFVAGLYFFPKLTADPGQSVAAEERINSEPFAASVSPPSSPRNEAHAEALAPGQTNLNDTSESLDDVDEPVRREASASNARNANSAAESRTTERENESGPLAQRNTDDSFSETRAAGDIETSRERSDTPTRPNEEFATDDSSRTRETIINPETTESSGLAIAAERLATENERQYAYFRGQGDLLLRQGFAEEALTRYDSALAYNESDSEFRARVGKLRDSLNAVAAAAEAERMVAEKRARVTDAQGIFIVPDTPPVLIDEQRLRERVVYPARAERAGIEGRVTVRMVVNENGSISNQTIVQSLGFGCDAEVLRILEQAQFRPATFDGEAVPAWYMFTVMFSQN